MVRINNIKVLGVGEVTIQCGTRKIGLTSHTWTMSTVFHNEHTAFIHLFVQNIKCTQKLHIHRWGQTRRKWKKEREKEMSVSLPTCREERRLSAAVKTRPGCFPSCSRLIRRELMNFWERPLQDPLNILPVLTPHCPLTSIQLFLQFLPFLFFLFFLRFEAEQSSQVLKGRVCVSYSKTTSMTPESWWLDTCQTAGLSAPPVSLRDSSCCCICSRITAWLSRHSLSLSSVSVRRSSSTATVWNTNGSC